MKIKKFNENLQPTGLKPSIFEDIIENSKRIIKLSEEKDRDISNLEPFMMNYLNIRKDILNRGYRNHDQDLWKDEDGNGFKICSIFYSVYNKNYFLEISYWTDAPYYDEEISGVAYFTKEDLEDFMQYANGPDLYKNSQKYNL